MIDVIRIPYRSEKPADKQTDTCTDCHISLDRLGTFMGEMLVAAHLLEAHGSTVGPIRPELHDWLAKQWHQTSGLIPAPSITIEHKNMQSAMRHLSRPLIYSRPRMPVKSTC